MPRLPVLWLALLASLLLAARPEPGSLPFRVAKQVPRKQRTQSPTFDGLTRPQAMDRGHLLYLGKGMWSEQHQFYLLDLRDTRLLKVEAPLAAFLEKERALFPGARGNGWPRYRVGALLFYDTDHQQAGILLDDGLSATHHYYLHWDLRRQRIVAAVLLAEADRSKSWVQIHPLGYDPRRRELHCVVAEGSRRTPHGPVAVSVVAAGARGKRAVASFRTSRNLCGQHYDEARNRALIVEYDELPLQDAGPRGFLVDLATGKVGTVALPVTTYGITFGADGRVIYAYSAQLGELWAVDVASGQRRRTLGVGKLGHALGFSSPDTLLVLRNAGLQLVDPRRWVRGRFLPVGRIYRGFSHVEGSLVLPGRVAIVNGELLYLVELR